MPDTPDHAEIIAFLKSEQAAYYRGDFEAFIAHWHHGPEVRRILSGPNVGTRMHMGWDELLPKFKEGFRQFPQNFDITKLVRWENLQIIASGEMAWISYDQYIDDFVEGIHAGAFGHETKIVRRFGDTWKMMGLIVVVPSLGREDCPRIELDVRGKITHINALAKARIGDNEGLALSADRLRARQRHFDLGLQSALKDVCKRLSTNLPSGFWRHSPIVVPLGEDNAGRPMFCWISTEQERVIVSFDDDHLLRSRLEMAAQSFGLSPAQIDIAQRLASGEELAAIATASAVSVNTVRTQVRRMFEKTNTHHQAALVSQLLNVQGPD